VAAVHGEVDVVEAALALPLTLVRAAGPRDRGRRRAASCSSAACSLEDSAAAACRHATRQSRYPHSQAGVRRRARRVRTHRHGRSRRKGRLLQLEHAARRALVHHARSMPSARCQRAELFLRLYGLAKDEGATKIGLDLCTSPTVGRAQIARVLREADGRRQERRHNHATEGIGRDSVAGSLPDTGFWRLQLQ